MAIPWVGSVNPTGLTCRNKPEGHDLGLNTALVSDDMYVVHAALVN